MSFHRDVSKLKSMLSYRRPDRSPTEEAFIKRFILPLGVEKDAYGNHYKFITKDGVAPDTLWSCHTDSVHKNSGRQTVVYDKKSDTIRLADPKSSACLGADCAAGVFIMTEMIFAGVPGLYVFHRGEESGAKGANFVYEKTNLLDGITKAIAFDRMGHSSVITHQCGSRTASDAFAQSMIEQLKGFTNGYKIDTGGVFTDTQVYADRVPECSNISVGYEGQHSSHEIQYVATLLNLRDAMLMIDSSKLVVDRDPKKIEKLYYNDRFKNVDQFGLYSDGTMENLIYYYPVATAKVLAHAEVSYEALARAIRREVDKARVAATEAFLTKAEAGGVEEIDDDISHVGDATEAVKPTQNAKQSTLMGEHDDGLGEYYQGY